MDFAEFLAQFEEVDYLRMDIEGAEYEVLLRCFEKGLMGRVKVLSLELHAHKIAGLNEQHNLLVQKLKEWGVSGKLSMKHPKRIEPIKHENSTK